MRFEVKSPKGDLLKTDEGKALLDERSLTLNLLHGDSRVIPYFEIFRIDERDYKVNLDLGFEMITLSELGYDYENFLRNLYKLRGELLLRYMLMNEGCVAKGIDAHFVYIDTRNLSQEGECEVRIYESAVVALPEKADPIRIPLCYINSHQREDYTFSIFADAGEKLILSQMGERTDYFSRSLSKALADVEVRTQSMLGSLAPKIDPNLIRMAAGLMGDGKAASGKDIESISPQLWLGLEENLKLVGLTEEYNYLKDLSKPGVVRIGVKRGLMGDKTGQYVWFMAPIYDSDPVIPGNALVLEAASDEVSGRATYVFRIMDRIEYSRGVSSTKLEENMEAFVHRVNRCLIEINFRREPIYLLEDKLREPDNERYLYAAHRLASLQLLRENFIGRVFHSSPDKWRGDLVDLLKFNVESVNNTDKWGK
jgi:hypothetical protein